MTVSTRTTQQKLVKLLFTGLLLAAAWYLTTARVSAQDKLKVEYQYLTYLPKQYRLDTVTYPLIIYLHGGSQKGHDLQKLKVYGLPHLIDQGKDFDFIVVSPQCPDGKYWSTENWFDPLYAKVSTDYRIDSNRVYVTGISMGGYGTYVAALDHPEKITAIVPLCGGINDQDISRLCTIKEIPVLTYHGTADDEILVAETERIDELLKACNGNIIFNKLEGEGHAIQYLYDTSPEIYEWMLKQHKHP